MNSSNIIVSVLYLKEASDLLIDNEPEISLTLLRLAKALLESYQIPEEQVDKAKQESNEIIASTEQKSDKIINDTNPSNINLNADTILSVHS